VIGENETPHKNDDQNVDLEIDPPNDEPAEPVQDQEPIQDQEPTAPPIVETVHEAEQPQEEQVEIAPEPAPEPPTAPGEIPGVRRSTRVRFPVNTGYTPSMSGSSKYAYAVTQMASQEALHPDAHMFFNHCVSQEPPDVVAMIMTQLSLKAGLKEWGEKGTKAARSEMKQLHFRETFKPYHWSELSHTQKQSVLESHMFLKEKRDGKIKGRTVAGGNKQRDFISKEDASSPTVATEAVLLTSIIDALEGRDVAVIDIPNRSFKQESKTRKIWCSSRSEESWWTSSWK
jgi:hypothetical protein